MIAAIYARKSTEQNGERARAYDERKGRPERRC